MNLPDTGFVVLKREVNTLSLTSNPLFLLKSIHTVTALLLVVLLQPPQVEILVVKCLSLKNNSYQFLSRL